MPSNGQPKAPRPGVPNRFRPVEEDTGARLTHPGAELPGRLAGTLPKANVPAADSRLVEAMAAELRAREAELEAARAEIAARKKPPPAPTRIEQPSFPPRVEPGTTQSAPSSIPPKSPRGTISFDLGSPKWWVVLITGVVGLFTGAGAIGAKITADSYTSPTLAKQATVDALSKQIDRLNADAENYIAWHKLDYAEREAKDAMILGYLCARGFRASGVDCEDVLRKQKPEDSAGKTFKPPAWRSGEKWPGPRLPPDRSLLKP